MTSEERLDRIERITATPSEERRKDREEYRTRWRDTQRQINENSAAIARNTIAIADLTDKLDRLGERIAALVSAIGQHVSQDH